MEGVVRCKGCGMWLMATFRVCRTCKTKTTEKGNSDAESNQRRHTMLGARETSEGNG
jgi:hypothetical protein